MEESSIYEIYEIYEIKIQPRGFNIYNYKHFDNISSTLLQHNVSNRMFCVVFEDSTYMEQQMDNIQKVYGKKVNINIIGGDHLEDLNVILHHR